MDGVIVDTISAICTLYNEDFQYYKQFKKVNGWEVNSYGFEECSCASKQYINAYFNQKRFFDALEFMPLAKESIERLKEKYEVKIVTMGYSPNGIGKALWLNKNLPDTEMIFVNMKEYEDKSHIDMSAGIFIDDNSKNLFTSNAKEKILFGDDYSWNSDWDGEVLRNWASVVKELL